MTGLGYGPGWTDERVALLRKCWVEGLSASQISKQLGGVTRNAVIGKVHRLGLNGRATPSRPAKRPMRVARTRIYTPSPPRTRSTVSEFMEAVKRSATLQPLTQENGEFLDVLRITDAVCKFPIGDPTAIDFGFCGRVACGGPYCSDHSKLTYQPSAKRQRKPEDDQLRAARTEIRRRSWEEAA